ncbi:hypothetical protein BH10ACI4_BH10ACI4_25170 [soil metagenome]
MAKLESTAARFIQKIDIRDDGSNCWIWVGSQGSSGYGTFQDEQGKVVYAHRWAFQNLRSSPKNAIPVGLEIGHICPGGSNSLCVNPRHLSAMTHQQNGAWMKKEKRGQKKHPGYRAVSATEYADIISSHQNGESTRSISLRLNRASAHIRALITGKSRPMQPAKPKLPKQPRPVAPSPVYLNYLGDLKDQFMVITSSALAFQARSAMQREA